MTDFRTDKNFLVWAKAYFLDPGNWFQHPDEEFDECDWETILAMVAAGDEWYVSGDRSLSELALNDAYEFICASFVGWKARGESDYADSERLCGN